MFLDLLFHLSENYFVFFYTFNLLDNLLQLVLNQGGNDGSSDVDPGLRDGGASFKMVNFEVRHLKKTFKHDLILIFCPLKESTARSGDAGKFHDLFSRRNSYGQSFIPDILHQV